MGYKNNDRCLERVGEDEPIFVLRCKDKLMIPTIRYWLDSAHETLTPEHHTEVGILLDAAYSWQQAHPELVHNPD